MTIKEYIKIHTKDSYIYHYCITIKPFSVCEKKSQRTTRSNANCI